MQISCEKCSTAYVLDDKLVPAGGAPVQCTRCGHVFLAVPEDQARRDRSGTQLFGIHAPPESAGDADPGEPKTQVYGGGARASTQMFGAVGAPPAPPQPRASTQMFGAAGTPPAPEPRASTQMFGAVGGTPAASPPPRASTQMFGAAGMPPAPEPRASTQMFGAVGSPPPAAEPQGRASTQMFGAVGTPAPPQQRASTQMFGAVGTPPAAEPPQSRASTQMFGAVTLPPPAEPAPRASTQMFGAVTTPPASPPPQRASTQMFGAVGTPPAPAPAPRHTQMFGAAKVTAAGAGAPTHAPIPTAEFEAVTGEPVRPYAKIELPPESAQLPVLDGLREDAPAPVRTPPRSGGGAGKWIALAFGAVLLAGGGYGAYRFIDARRNAIAPELQVGREAAVGLLRRDDPESHQRAVAQLEGILASNPSYVEAQADLVLALSLQLDDARARTQALQGSMGVLTTRIGRLEGRQSPSDWQNRVNVLTDTSNALRAQLQPLSAAASKLEQRLEVELARLAVFEQRAKLPPATALVVARARAVHHAVRGEDQSGGYVEQLKALRETGGWMEVAVAELAANARLGDDARAEAARTMTALTASDSSFLRPYVLAARLELERGRLAEASEPLETALTLNPNHATAAALLEWVRAEREVSSEDEQQAPTEPQVVEPAPQ